MDNMDDQNKLNAMRAQLAQRPRAELLGLTEHLMAVMQAHGLTPDSMDEAHAASWDAAEADFLAQTGFAMQPVLDVASALHEQGEAELAQATEALAEQPMETLFALWQDWEDLLAARGLTPEAVDQASPEAWADLETAFFAQTGHPFEALLNTIARHAPPQAGQTS